MAEETRFKSVHPVIPVRDMTAMIAFYDDKLGFRKAFDDAAKSGDAISYAGVHRGGLCLHFQTVTPGDDPTMPQIRIRVENIEPLYEEYKAKGVIHPGGQLELKPWGSKDFGLYDPENTALVFFEDV